MQRPFTAAAFFAFCGPFLRKTLALPPSTFKEAPATARPSSEKMPRHPAIAICGASHNSKIGFLTDFHKHLRKALEKVRAEKMQYLQSYKPVNHGWPLWQHAWQRYRLFFCPYHPELTIAQRWWAEVISKPYSPTLRSWRRRRDNIFRCTVHCLPHRIYFSAACIRACHSKAKQMEGDLPHPLPRGICISPSSLQV